jgi:hypothetical protein
MLLVWYNRGCRVAWAVSLLTSHGTCNTLLRHGWQVAHLEDDAADAPDVARVGPAQAEDDLGRPVVPRADHAGVVLVLIRRAGVWVSPTGLASATRATTWLKNPSSDQLLGLLQLSQHTVVVSHSGVKETWNRVRCSAWPLFSPASLYLIAGVITKDHRTPLLLLSRRAVLTCRSR